jgi:CHASE2 domain-containing sensor protein
VVHRRPDNAGGLAGIEHQGTLAHQCIGPWQMRTVAPLIDGIRGIQPEAVNFDIVNPQVPVLVRGTVIRVVREGDRDFVGTARQVQSMFVDGACRPVLSGMLL